LNRDPLNPFSEAAPRVKPSVSVAL